MQGTIKQIVFNKNFANIEFEDGSKLSGNVDFDARFKDLKKGDVLYDYTIVKEKFINLKKDVKAAGNFLKRDYTVEKRLAALNASVTLVTHSQIKADQLFVSADKCLEWLNR